MSARRNAAVAFVAALAMGGTATLSLFAVLEGYADRIAHARQEEDVVLAVTAARDLYPGMPIEEGDLMMIELPPRFVPEGAFLNPEHLMGRMAKERILANEIVRSDRLAYVEHGDGLSTVIPARLRAVSVEITDGAALSGFLRAGDYVDVLSTPDALERTNTLLQDVFILAVDGDGQGTRRNDERGQGMGTVTMLVTPEQAEQVAHAEQIGEVRMTLRTAPDHTIYEREPEVVLEPPPLPKRVLPPREEPVEETTLGTIIKIIEGTNVEDIEIVED